MEDTNVIPMDSADILSEAGRYGVLVRLIEDDFRDKVGRDSDCPGFYEVFSFLYALLDEISIRQELLVTMPKIAYETYKNRKVVCEETEVMYAFPEGIESPIVDLAILYCAEAHSFGGDEIPLLHLPYLFSMADQIEEYTLAGYRLYPEAADLVAEAKRLMESRAKPNQAELYISMESRLKEVYEQTN
ncbi:MAG: hypothetical protein K6F32_05260 [Bacilli bacterium]|nr:hypothetical protein [Bacilli bacterium]